MCESVILKVSKSEQYGRVAKIEMEFSELYPAREHADTLNSFPLPEGEFYISCKKKHIRTACHNISAAFIE